MCGQPSNDCLQLAVGFYAYLPTSVTGILLTGMYIEQYEIICASSLLCLKNTLSLSLLITLDSNNLSIPSFTWFREPWEEGCGMTISCSQGTF